jgi:excisionase family DNA binding protein
MEIDKLLTQKEVAEITGLSLAYFEQARHKGNSRLVYIKIGRAVRYRLSDVQRWIESNVIGAGI